MRSDKVAQFWTVLYPLIYVLLGMMLASLQSSGSTVTTVKMPTLTPTWEANHAPSFGRDWAVAFADASSKGSGCIGAAERDGELNTGALAAELTRIMGQKCVLRRVPSPASVVTQAARDTQLWGLDAALGVTPSTVPLTIGGIATGVFNKQQSLKNNCNDGMWRRIDVMYNSSIVWSLPALMNWASNANAAQSQQGVEVWVSKRASCLS